MYHAMKEYRGVGVTFKYSRPLHAQEINILNVDDSITDNRSTSWKQASVI
jgi:hypothetical protein